MTPQLLLQIVFWASLLALVHSYVVYPALIRRLAKGRGSRQLSEEKVFTESDPSSEWPYLVVAIAAHNEEAVMRETLRSIFAADYPEDRFEVMIAADNCSDRTHEIIEEFQRDHECLSLRVFPGRNGKIRVINQLLAENRERLSGKGDYVLMLCDANVRWSPDLPSQLAKHFRDDRIGQVAPNVLDSRREHHGIADEEEAYINRENEIKHAEGVLWGRMMGAFGACYAIRGRLVDAVPENFVVDDFFHTMRCFELGHDAIVEPRAVCYEDVSEDVGEEFRRKRRIAIGNFQNLNRFRKLLFGLTGDFAAAFAFWSHKGLRWMGPFLLIGAFGSSLLLAPASVLYSLALAGQIGLITLAFADALFGGRGVHLKLPRFVRYFYLMNLALMLGAIRFLGGVKSNVWEPTRRVAASSHASLPDSAMTTPAATSQKPAKPAPSPPSRV